MTRNLRLIISTLPVLVAPFKLESFQNISQPRLDELLDTRNLRSGVLANFSYELLSNLQLLSIFPFLSDHLNWK